MVGDDLIPTLIFVALAFAAIWLLNWRHRR
jgi:hypothetical protein